jgi:hypothetical protein
MDFFDNSLITTVSAAEFGLCDNSDGSCGCAFVGYSEEESNWIATVKNPKMLVLSFVPVDKGVLADDDPNWYGRGRCDGMLFDDSHIFFVELKEKKRVKGWVSEAAKQLKDTIELFISVHGPDKINNTSIKNRRVYACNKQHPSFNCPTLEAKEMFHRLGFRFYIEATIDKF